LSILPLSFWWGETMCLNPQMVLLYILQMRYISMEPRRMILAGENRRTREKPDPVPLFPS
jgi:hypothetical protein